MPPLGGATTTIRLAKLWAGPPPASGLSLRSTNGKLPAERQRRVFRSGPRVVVAGRSIWNLQDAERDRVVSLLGVLGIEADQAAVVLQAEREAERIGSAVVVEVQAGGAKVSVLI